MGRKEVDLQLLHRLWHTTATLPEIAVQLGVGLSTLYELRKRHKLARKTDRRHVLPVDPTPEELVERCRVEREKHYAKRRGESDQATKARAWRGDGA